MAECVDDEEREAVYAQVKETVETMKMKIQKRGDAIIEDLKQQAKQAAETKEKEQKKSNINDHVQNIKDTLNKVSESLDEALDSIKPDTDGPIPAV